uniref:Kruppel homologue 1 n=1 Tax=Blattella germanica TaxID=6973 RepID=G8ADQ0_BLAGE|nr:kruppel homologue 1 [Blattella germanica]
MVGYFNTEDGSGRQHERGGVECTGGPLLPEQHPEEREAPVKRLVCSPDLPVFSLTQAFEEAAAAAVVESTSTTTPTSAPAAPVAAVTTATGDKVYECSFCHKTFPQKNTYQNHLRSHGKEGEDPYQCNICGKTFAVPARLTRHYRTHTGEKPYQCEYCSKSFSVKENLSVHRRIHTKERPYKCDICARAFEHSGKLHRHMRIHTGERPHKCGVCAKTFIQSGQLVIHMRTHTGEKPYVCAACGKGFTCSKQLKVHTRTHTGEKPYSCDICGKAFGYNHVLKLHQVAHYGEKVYKCTICSQTFTSKKTMEVHIKSHSEPARSPQPPLVQSAARQQNGDLGESSCASSSSDKENKGDSDCEPPPRVPSLNSEFDPSEVRSLSPSPAMPFSSPALHHPPEQEPRHPHHHHQHQNHHEQMQLQQHHHHLQHQTLPQQTQPHPNIRELCYSIYCSGNPPYQQREATSSSGVNPVLLAVAAAASEGRSLSPLPGSEDHDDEDMVFRRRQEEMSEPALPVTEPSVYLCPEPLASMQRRASPYHFQLPPPDYPEEPMQISLPLTPAYSTSSSSSSSSVGGGRRRRPLESEEHEMEQDPLLTPPSSNPVSPVPSSSPDPIDLATVSREALILPPRKRSKMILKSMETAEPEVVSVRSRSVIHYARAS